MGYRFKETTFELRFLKTPNIVIKLHPESYPEMCVGVKLLTDPTMKKNSMSYTDTKYQHKGLSTRYV